MTHDGSHENCFGCKLKTIQFGAGPAPQTLMERRWAEDMPAYARLRRDGLQPRMIDGSAEVEAQVNQGQLEVDMRHLFNENFGAKDLPRLADTMEEVQSTGWQPSQSMDDYRDKQT
jgi:hypothetical protein